MSEYALLLGLVAVVLLVVVSALGTDLPTAYATVSARFLGEDAGPADAGGPSDGVPTDPAGGGDGDPGNRSGYGSRNGNGNGGCNGPDCP
jgi:Flp pilus assembly pilin Flp